MIVRNKRNPRGVGDVIVDDPRFHDLLVNDPRAFDFGAFRGLEGMFGEDMVLPELDFTQADPNTDPGYVSPYPNDPIQTSGGTGWTSDVSPNTTPADPSTTPATDWSKLFEPAAKLLGTIFTGVMGAVVAGQKNPQGGYYTQAQADQINRARQAQGGMFGLSPLMIGGIAVIGIGAVLLMMNRRSAPAATAGYGSYGKRKRRRAKSRRR